MSKYFYLITFLCLGFTLPAKAQIDSVIGIKAPKSISRNNKKLAHFLCDTVEGDSRKVNAIYNWVTHNIKYDVKAMQKGDLKRPSTKQILKKKKALCDGYSELFSELCNEVGVRALVVDGYARDWMFDDGDKFYTPRHAWNAVAIGNSWYLVDVTWGAGVIGQFPNGVQKKFKKIKKDPVQHTGKLKFKYRYDPSFFMQSPAQFRLNHLPYYPLWQLTDSLMPLYLFEAGEDSIIAFNKTYGRPRMEYKELNRFANLPEHMQTIEEAERGYRYNPRFHVSMALWHQGNAIDTLASMDKHAPPAVRQAVISQVDAELKQAEKYVALQKKSIVSEYTELKTKNKKKNTEAKAHIRTLNTNNTQAIARCKAKIKSSDSKYRSLNSKAGTGIALHRKVKPEEFAKLKTASPEDKPTVERLEKLEDSIKIRIGNQNSAMELISKEQAVVDRLIEANSKRLDSLVDWLHLADSALIQETIGRINLQDNYDAGIKKWTAIYKTSRFQNADSLQRQYLAGYDSNLVHFDLLKKNHDAYLDLYRKNFKDLEQYKKRNRTNAAVLSLYGKEFEAYSNAYGNYQQMLSQYAGYIKGNKSLFEQMVKHYERQEKLTKYMERSEEKRQKLEETNLVKKEAFDKKENEYQKKQLKRAGEKSAQYVDNKRNF